MSHRESHHTSKNRSSERQLTADRLERMARLLDVAYRLPGTKIRFGLDSLIGLVPVIGDLGSTAFSAYIIYEAYRLKLPKRAIGRMIGNVALETVIGSIPLVGDGFDLFWRANMRNARMVRRYVGGSPGSAAPLKEAMGYRTRV